MKVGLLERGRLRVERVLFVAIFRGVHTLVSAKLFWLRTSLNTWGQFFEAKVRVKLHSAEFL